MRVTVAYHTPNEPADVACEVIRSRVLMIGIRVLIIGIRVLIIGIRVRIIGMTLREIGEPKAADAVREVVVDVVFPHRG